jgi:hypothetical protein
MATLDSGRQRHSMNSCASHQRPLERPYWQAEALHAFQPEIDAKEAWARQGSRVATKWQRTAET